jgi:hypothetical protein
MLYIPPSICVSSLVPDLVEVLKMLVDPPVYPTIELYPTVRALGEFLGDVQSGWARFSEQILNRSLSVRLDHVYPNFDICAFFLGDFPFRPY